MNNKEFQQELKEKLKEGIKPSDLKKQKGNISKNNSTSSLSFNLPSNQQDLLAKIKKLEVNNNLLTKILKG